MGQEGVEVETGGGSAGSGRRDATQQRLTLEDHLEIVRAWQRRTGGYGKCPPKAEFPKTSNFVQWARKRVRDFGDRKYQVALASVGIEAEPAVAIVSKKFSASAQAILRFVREERKAPDLAAVDQGERELAAWLVRMQAGALPGKHLEWVRGPVSDLMEDVMTQVKQVQREEQMAQQWFEFCARSYDVMQRLNRGDMWGTRLHEAAPEAIREAFPWLSAAKSSCRAGKGRPALCAPDPPAVLLEINRELSSLPRSVEFATCRCSTAELQIRLANLGLLSPGMTMEHWVQRRGLRGAALVAKG